MGKLGIRFPLMAQRNYILWLRHLIWWSSLSASSISCKYSMFVLCRSDCWSEWPNVPENHIEL